MGRYIKKKRTQEPTEGGKGESSSSTDPQSPSSSLSTAPFEIVAEILFHTSSPKDVLALARCSKHLFATLVKNSASQFIWRRSRALCKPPVPDPTPNFTEVSYAAYIFDGGECEVCKKHTKDMYSSFALRLRVCGSLSCEKQLPNLLYAPSFYITDSVRVGIIKWIATSESMNCFVNRGQLRYPSHSNVVTYPSHVGFIRRVDWTLAMAEFNEAQKTTSALKAYQESRKKLIVRLPKLMNLSYLLFLWKIERTQIYEEKVKKNIGIAKKFANEEGVATFALKQTPAFTQLFLQGRADLEEILDSDFKVIRPAVLEDLKRIEARNNRRLSGQAQDRRLKMIDDHYHKLKSTAPRRALPPLSVFRKLPVVDLFRSSETCQEPADKKKFRLMVELLDDEIEKWLKGVRGKLAEMLGFEGWKAPDSKTIHPAERITARFRCVRCDKCQDLLRHRSLDFIDVCRHTCPSIGKKRALRTGCWDSWYSEMFVKDEKASDLVSKILKAYDIDPERTTAFAFSDKASSFNILCTSCPSAIVMKYECIFDHAQRHDKTGVNFLGLEAPTALASDLTSGLAKRLVRTDPVAQKTRAHAEFVCRHCVQKDVGVVLPSSKWSLMTFDGARSHLKALHNVVMIGDEDFFRASEEVVEAKKKGAAARREKAEVNKAKRMNKDQSSTPLASGVIEQTQGAVKIKEEMQTEEGEVAVGEPSNAGIGTSEGGSFDGTKSGSPNATTAETSPTSASSADEITPMAG